MGFYQELGENIRNARLSAGMNQAELAVRIGRVSPSSICYIEHGLRKPSILDLLVMANVFGMSIDDMLPHVDVTCMYDDDQQTNIFDIMEEVEDAS